jgi:hypothetical protein
MASPSAPQLGQASLPDIARSVSTTMASAREQVAKAMPLIDVPRHKAAVADLERRSSMADLWDDAASAEATLRELSEHRAEVERSVKWTRTLDDAEAALLLLPDLTGEPEAAVELLSDELAQLHALTAELAEWEVLTLDLALAVPLALALALALTLVLTLTLTLPLTLTLTRGAS